MDVWVYWLNVEAGIGLFSRILSLGYLDPALAQAECGLKGSKGAVQYLCFRRGSTDLSKTADGELHWSETESWMGII